MSVRPSSGSPIACSGDMYITVPTAAPGLVRLDGTLLCGRFRHRREAEVEQLGVAARRDEDVGRLDVAMHDAGVVRGVERVGDLHAEVDDGAGRQRPRPEHVEQRHPAEQLHHQIRPIAGLGRLADVVDGADVRMVQ